MVHSWGAWGFNEASAFVRKAYSPTVGSRCQCTTKHPAIVCLNCLRAAVAVLGDELGSQGIRNCTGKESACFNVSNISIIISLAEILD
jgi:hypothetical protein